MKILIASDHAGFKLKDKIKDFLNKKAINYEDLGAYGEDLNDDYPDYAFKVAERVSKEKNLVSEGCLSVDKIFGEISRSKRAVIEAYNEYGRKFRRSASGLFAQAMQHETDHLSGVLFIDTAINLKKLEDSEKEKK